MTHSDKPPTVAAAMKRPVRWMRLALTSLIVLISALLVGFEVVPWARVAYHKARLDSPSRQARLRALEVLANAARSRRDLDELLFAHVDALLAADMEDDREQGRQLAGYLLRRAPGFAAHIESAIAETPDDALFARWARQLSRAGMWETPSRPLEQKVRLGLHHFRSASDAWRPKAIQELASLGPAAGERIAAALGEGLADPSAAVRRASLEAAAVVLVPARWSAMVQGRTEDPDATVRVRLCELAGVLHAPGLADRVRRLVESDESPAARAAAGWALLRLHHPPPPQPQGPYSLFGDDDDDDDDDDARARIGWDQSVASVRGLLADPAVEVRQMAAWSFADAMRTADGWVASDAVLRGLVDALKDANDDPGKPKDWREQHGVLRARCVRALGLLGEEDHRKMILDATRDPDLWTRLAALEALPHGSDRLVTGTLTRALDEAIATDWGLAAAVALRSMARLAASDFDASTRDQVAGLAEFAEQQMVRLEAVRTMLAWRADRGPGLLLLFFSVDRDAPRDRAAMIAAGDARVTDEMLREKLLSFSNPARCAAALALALRGATDVVPRPNEEDRLLEYLRRRTEPDSPLLEADWKVAGYYWCARKALGDEGVGPALDRLLLNEQFPDTAVYLAMLHAGDPRPMDMMFVRPLPDGVDLDVFLRLLQFSAVIERYVPTLPRVPLSGDPALRAWQIDRLRDAWRVHRQRVRWDAQRRRFVFSKAR